MIVPEDLRRISDSFSQNGHRLVIVGGAVRDFFLGVTPREYDCEVYGVSSVSLLADRLSPFGKVIMKGRDFGVVGLVIEGRRYEFALPRREIKVGEGHFGFEIEIVADLSYSEAARRRDFTMNSLGYEVDSGTFLDPFDGRKDIKNKVLRHITDHFSEDPFRVLRAARFMLRFGLSIAPETRALCREMGPRLREISKARVCRELDKIRRGSSLADRREVFWYLGIDGDMV